MTPSDKKGTPAWPVLVAAVLLFGGVTAFVLLFINLSGAEMGDAVPSELSSESYMTTVAELLAQADPSRGEELVKVHGCNSCHTGIAATNKFAPMFAGVGVRAKERRLPLTPEAYIYESIVHPTAFVVDGYRGQMPAHYGELPPDELGSMIAYLLTLES